MGDRKLTKEEEQSQRKKKMSDRKVTMEEIDKVHNYIEQCLTKYMTKKETERALFTQCNIEPCFTDIIWKRLEEENQAFFREYYIRLALQKQIIQFNRLLEQQAILMRQQGLLNDASSIAAADNNKLNMPPSDLGAENTGPALMPCDEKTVADWYKKNCGSYMNPQEVKTDVGFRGLSIDGGGGGSTSRRRESLANAAADAHNNATPPSSQYINGRLNMSHEDMSNLPPTLSYMGERQSQDNNAGSDWHQQNFRFMESGAGDLAENTGPALMPSDEQIVADWLKNCASFMDDPQVQTNVGGGSRKETLANPTEDQKMSGYYPYAACAHNNYTPSPSAIYNPSLPSSSRMGSNSQYVNGRPDRCSLIGRRGDNREEQLVRYRKRGTHLAVEDSQQAQQLVNSRERSAPIPESVLANLQQSQQLINSRERGTHLAAIGVGDSQQAQQLVNSRKRSAPIPASAVASLQQSQQLVNGRERCTHLAAINVEHSQQAQQLVNSHERDAPIPASTAASLQQPRSLIQDEQPGLECHLFFN